MAQKFWYILSNSCEFFQILEWWFSFFNIVKTKSKKNLYKIGCVFFDRYFCLKNYGEDLRHHWSKRSLPETLQNTVVCVQISRSSTLRLLRWRFFSKNWKSCKIRTSFQLRLNSKTNETVHLLKIENSIKSELHAKGGGQNLERRNVERPILQNYEY